MERQVKFAQAAQIDVAAVNLWLTQPGAGAYAAKRRRVIADAILELSVFPARWPVGDHPGVRERPVFGYRIMYEVEPDTGDGASSGDVLILRVFGPRQDRSAL